MALVLFLTCLLLALVFLVAGLAKLADLPGSRATMRDFGVPASLAGPAGTLLPLAELIVAGGLLMPHVSWWGALGALALLLLFVAGIVLNLARGRTPNCHCFGQLHSAPAGWSTLIRNLVLAALSGLVVVFGRTTDEFDLGSWLGQLSLTQRLELIGAVVGLSALVGEGWLLFQILSQQGRLLLRLEAVETRLAGFAPQTGGAAPTGLEVGTLAPAFSLADVQGETLTLANMLARGKPVLLLFADPGCGPCAALLPEVGRWQRDYASKLTVVVISRGSLEANQGKFKAHGITRVLLQQEREVQSAYQVTGTPSAVLIGADGTIGSWLAQGADAIEGLVASTIGLPVLRSVPMAVAPAQHNGNGAHARLRPPVPAIGEPAPEFSLPSLEGNQVKLSDFRGRRTLVLFWRPSCGFCQRMLADLKAWEKRPPEGAPTLVVVSSESRADNQAMGLHSPVVLDHTAMSVGSQFGATGTPMAVLVDEQGKIASTLAAGAPAVLALARGVQEMHAPG